MFLNRVARFSHIPDHSVMPWKREAVRTSRVSAPVFIPSEARAELEVLISLRHCFSLVSNQDWDAHTVLSRAEALR